MRKRFYILDTVTNQSYNPDEGQFCSPELTPCYEGDKNYLLKVIEVNRDALRNCIIAEVLLNKNPQI